MHYVKRNLIFIVCRHPAYSKPRLIVNRMNEFAVKTYKMFLDAK